MIRQHADAKANEAEEPEEAETPKAAQIGDAIYADEIHLEVAPDLVSMALQGAGGR